MITDLVNKKIAIFLPTLVGGGAERVMLNLADEFASRGCQVDFVLAQCEGAFMSQIPVSVNLVELNTSHVKSGRSVRSLPALVRYLRQERPAAVLTGLHANIIAVWAKKISGVPFRLILSEHNTTTGHRQTYPLWTKAIFPTLKRWFYPMADKIIAVSYGVAEDLQNGGIPREKITIVANPIITNQMVAKTSENLEHDWFAPGQPPVLLSVGRLTAQKDFPLLIKAFAEIHRTRPARLLILGDGSDRSILLSLVANLGVEKDVSLPGFVHNPYPYMKHAAVFVLSSQWEGLPTVLVEALYCGAPIVSTDCHSGPRQILKDGAYGRLVPVGDQKSLASAILQTLDSPRTYQPAECWRPYEAGFVVEQYLNLLLSEKP